MSPTAEERETTIQYDDSGETAVVYTCHKSLAARLVGLKSKGAKLVREDRNSGKTVAWQFEVPKSWVHIRPPRRVSAAQAQAAGDRMRRYHDSRRTYPVDRKSEQGWPIPEVAE